jgi:hypothetical protein
MMTQSRLDINHLGRELLYQTHQTASGWGLRALTPDEIGIALRLPAFQRFGGLTMGSFPLVLVQIMDGILKAYGRRKSHQTPLRTPKPGPAVSDTKKVGHLWSNVICLTIGLIPIWSRQRQPRWMMQASSSQCGMLNPHSFSHGWYTC